MIRSMTGFARAVSPKKRGGWAVEIRSLNHRYFEFSLKSPPSLYGLEDRIRELCQSRIRRGKVTLNINEANDSGLEEVGLDEKVLQFYLSAIRKIQRRFHLEGSLSVSDLLSLPRIFSAGKKVEVPEKMWRSLKPLLEQALFRLLESRLREGRALSKELLMRVGKIETGLRQIERRAKDLPGEYYEKLRERVRGIFEEKIAEDERVWQAAALLAEKADITEEVVRLGSHLRLFRQKIATQGEVGKELDFLLQEMNRETNTIGAKAQDFGVSREVISIKAELEKIREQIQNVE
jgi:uncharacterized protein (TIGR00255 family)